MPEWVFLTSYHGTSEKGVPTEGTTLTTSNTQYDSVYRASLWRSVFAEFIGLTLLVSVGVGSSVPWTDEPTGLQVALGNGLTVATLIHCLFSVSGAHINPAVTISLMLYRKISFLRCCLYVLFQCAGACLGAEILKVVTPEDVYESANGTFGCTVISPDIRIGQGFLLELVITFQLLLTISAVADEGRLDLNGSNALAIGLSVVCGIIFGFPYTGGSMNPARSFGTAALAGHWDNHWVYWLAPILGGITGVSVYEFCFAQRRLQRSTMV